MSPDVAAPADQLLDRRRRVHLLGIGGAGMSAIAEVLVAMGHAVSGSDRSDGPTLSRLRAIGVTVYVGHDATHLGTADLVGVSSAVGEDNPELVAALRTGVDVRPRADLLAAVAACRPTLSISGTHGKTTTSALAVAAATGASLDPSFIIGGVVAPFGTGARWADGELFVLEADESDGSFLVPARVGAVVTNLEPDHLDHYGSFDALRAAFARFVDETAGPVVVCADDPGAAELARDRPHVITYGTDSTATLEITSLRSQGDGSWWTVSGPEWHAEVHVGVPGLHIVRNATAALGLVAACGGDPRAAATGIGSYQGVGRRFELRGAASGVTFVDDYAHLPAEIAATLQAARSAQEVRGWRRVVAVVQPHRYSRTALTAPEYRDLFDPADVVVVTDVYPAGEAPIPGVTGETIVEQIRRSADPPTVVWCPGRDETIERVLEILRTGDLCLTLGAGDLTTMPDLLVARLEAS